MTPCHDLCHDLTHRSQRDRRCAYGVSVDPYCRHRSWNTHTHRWRGKCVIVTVAGYGDRCGGTNFRFWMKPTGSDHDLVLQNDWLFLYASGRTLLNFYFLRVTISYQISWEIYVISAGPTVGRFSSYFQREKLFKNSVLTPISSVPIKTVRCEDVCEEICQRTLTQGIKKKMCFVFITVSYLSTVVKSLIREVYYYDQYNVHTLLSPGVDCYLSWLIKHKPIHGHLHYPAPADIDKPLNEVAVDQILPCWWGQDNRSSNSISFMPVVDNRTSSTTAALQDQFGFRLVAF